MWSRQLLGTDVYHLVGAFIVYSVLGWFLESVYMSFCNRHLTNRGFAKSPFCPIYGVGAMAGYFLLKPVGNLVGVYFVGALLATAFEYLVGRLMLRVFGQLWWDYNEKPFNYKGIICLESTVAWGFYAVGIVAFLQSYVYRLVDRVDRHVGIRLIYCIVAVLAVDYFIQLLRAFHVDVREKKDKLVERYQSFKARWY